MPRSMGPNDVSLVWYVLAAVAGGFGLLAVLRIPADWLAARKHLHDLRVNVATLRCERIRRLREYEAQSQHPHQQPGRRRAA
jgi:hypothetical protein